MLSNSRFLFHASQFQNLVKLANKNPLIHKNQIISSESKNIAGKSPSKNQFTPMLFWPQKIVLTGNVILQNSAYFSNQQQNSTGAINVGDVRIKRHYFSKNSPNFETFADKPPNFASSAFQLEEKKRSVAGKSQQNPFFQTASSHFRSVDEFSEQYHQLDGHELVYMQNINEDKLNRIPVGCLLIDVWVVPEIMQSNIQEKGKNEDNVDEAGKKKDFGFWAKLNGSERVIGVDDSSFGRNGEDELVLEQKYFDFLRRCKGVSVHNQKGKLLRIDPSKLFRGYSFQLGK
jgi:hypothetical protein